MTRPETSGTESRRRRLARLLAVIAAVVSAVGLWAVARFGLGIDVQEPQRPSGTRGLAVASVVIITALASFAGWALLAVLERFTNRAARWWAVIATLFAVISLIGPLTAPGIPASSRVVLALLHLVVGAALIPLLYRSSPSRMEQLR